MVTSLSLKVIIASVWSINKKKKLRKKLGRVDHQALKTGNLTVHKQYQLTVITSTVQIGITIAFKSLVPLNMMITHIYSNLVKEEVEITN